MGIRGGDDNRNEPPIEDVLDEFVPEWRDGELTPEQAVALFRERSSRETDGLLDLLNTLGKENRMKTAHYDPDDVATVAAWMDLVIEILPCYETPDAGEAEVLAGLEGLVRRCDLAYAELEAGDAVVIDPGDLGAAMKRLDPVVREAFTQLTSKLLMTGNDGPRASGSTLRRAVKRIAEADRNRG